MNSVVIFKCLFLNDFYQPNREQNLKISKDFLLLIKNCQENFEDTKEVIGSRKSRTSRINNTMTKSKSIKKHNTIIYKTNSQKTNNKTT